MKVKIEGITIELTKEQRSLITHARNKRKHNRGSFEKVLLHFGFERLHTGTPGFAYVKNDWFAQIIDHTNFSEVWMTGKGLQTTGSFPGGYLYGEPADLEKELLRATGSLQIIE